MKDNLKQIQSTMDYMERNLKTELNLQELSARKYLKEGIPVQRTSLAG